MTVFTKAIMQIKQKKTANIDSLLSLRTSLQKLGDVPNNDKIFDYAVNYFNIITSFQDNMDLSKFDKKAGEELDLIGKHIANSGRDPYGMVRAPKGDQVNTNNLYLGNLNGVWTATAEKFKSLKDKETKDIIVNQLYSFISSHHQPLIDLSDKVLSKGLITKNIAKTLAEKVR